MPNLAQIPLGKYGQLCTAAFTNLQHNIALYLKSFGEVTEDKLQIAIFG